MMTHHNLDPYPEPKDKTPIYINEPWLTDKTRIEYPIGVDPDTEEADNVRIYAPIDLNRKAILRRLDRIIACYGEANEGNEMEYDSDVNMLVSQIEIYDQIWYVRHTPSGNRHSDEAVSLVKEFVARLEDISDGCAECFPFEMIDKLKEEYLS